MPGLIAALALLAGSASARADEGARVEIMVLEVDRAESRQIDPALAEETQILQLLAPYDRIRIIERRTEALTVGRNAELRFSTPAGKKAQLDVELLARTADRMKLRVRCAALQDLDTTTSHQRGGTFLVVRPQSKVGVAIRRVGAD